MWARLLAIVVGVFSIGAAFFVLLFPGVAILTLVFLLGFALLFIGFDRLAAGISGHPHTVVVMTPVGSNAPDASTPAAPRSPP